MRRLLSLIALIAVLAVSCTPGKAPTVGAQAPDFELYNTLGQAVSLSDYLGRPVAVNFWGVT